MIRRPILTALLLALVLSLLSQGLAVAQETPGIVRIGHRGAPTLAPENTLASVDAALAAGVDAIEFDIKHFTADHKMIVLHDADLSRTTNAGKADVRNKTLAELRALDAGSWGPWANSRFAGQRLPVPEEMLQAILAGGAFPVVHIETLDQTPDVLRVLAETGARDKAVLFCFDYAVMERLAQEAPNVRKGWLLGDDAFENQSVASVVDRAKRVGCEVLAPSMGIVTAQLTQTCHSSGISVWTWTVNDEPSMDKMLDVGVDGIITDAPQLLNAVLTRRNAAN